MNLNLLVKDSSEQEKNLLIWDNSLKKLREL